MALLACLLASTTPSIAAASPSPPSATAPANAPPETSAAPADAFGPAYPAVWANRTIAVFREPLAGVAPAERARRAEAVLADLDDADLREPVTVRRIRYDERWVSTVWVGDRLALALAPGDVSVEGRSQALEVADAVRRLESALAAVHAQRRPTVIARGVGITLLTIAVAWLLVRLAGRGTQALQAGLEKRFRQREQSGGRWGEYALPLMSRLVGVARWVLYLFIAYTGVVVVLEAFPLTQPLSRMFAEFFVVRLHQFSRAAVGALPDIGTIVLILLLTRAVVDGAGMFFDNVHRGRLRAPFVYPETAAATKRLVSIVIWGLGIAFAYPYIPGSSSDAFKGLSVVFGLMLTLGSAGVVTQLMSGLVVVYSRALRRGDLVEVDGREAIVLEVNALATKLANLNRQEFTVPNAVLTTQTVRNYTRLAETGPIFLSVAVTIGYDAPWRQVHALLTGAVAATEGFDADPPPYVLQRALDDFYVRYELFASLHQPLRNLPHKPHLLSQLHANIQDAFNAAGVQIMSPHFEAQPEAPVLGAPAGPPPGSDRA
ncbi:mechanosensitive ion channel family protein [Novilysobacter selenitireducens]|uniref:Small-conductance mechanosensitive channel n=1 Tax=Novilysobacter selenitireducens TaxID=2872639 RepID=A0ABS7T5J1_9GAMM|nr:mechanosensitive ion channel domain-containing protein [Lysobacter selenitireducens]MBZ4039121.1 mechanosensitive ion channel family protein [Lysobacter selenitireducens]